MEKSKKKSEGVGKEKYMRTYFITWAQNEIFHKYKFSIAWKFGENGWIYEDPIFPPLPTPSPFLLFSIYSHGPEIIPYPVRYY